MCAISEHPFDIFPKQCVGNQSNNARAFWFVGSSLQFWYGQESDKQGLHVIFMQIPWMMSVVEILSIVLSYSYDAQGAHFHVFWRNVDQNLIDGRIF